MEKDFTIDKASWHTQRIRNYEFDNEKVYSYFKVIFKFLDDNKLSTRNLSTSSIPINDDTTLIRSDLTEEGFELIKKGLDRWVDNIFDKGKPTEDVKYLEKKLKEIRQKKGL